MKWFPSLAIRTVMCCSSLRAGPSKSQERPKSGSCTAGPPPSSASPIGNGFGASRCHRRCHPFPGEQTEAAMCHWRCITAARQTPTNFYSRPRRNAVSMSWPGLTAQRLITVGHSHSQFHRYSNGVHFINPGSVGRMFDGKISAACAVLTLVGHEIDVELHRIAYPVEAVIAELHRVRLPAIYLEMYRRGRKLN